MNKSSGRWLRSLIVRKCKYPLGVSVRTCYTFSWLWKITITSRLDFARLLSSDATRAFAFLFIKWPRPAGKKCELRSRACTCTCIGQGAILSHSAPQGINCGFLFCKTSLFTRLSSFFFLLFYFLSYGTTVTHL